MLLRLNLVVTPKPVVAVVADMVEMSEGNVLPLVPSMGGAPLALARAWSSRKSCWEGQALQATSTLEVPQQVLYS